MRERVCILGARSQGGLITLKLKGQIGGILVTKAPFQRLDFMGPGMRAVLASLSVGIPQENLALPRLHIQLVSY